MFCVQVLQDLQAQLPQGVTLQSVEECEIKKMDGSKSETLHQLITGVEYEVAVQQVAPGGATASVMGGPREEGAPGGGSGGRGDDPPPADNDEGYGAMASYQKRQQQLAATAAAAAAATGGSSAEAPDNDDAAPSLPPDFKRFDPVAAVAALRDTTEFIITRTGGGKVKKEIKENVRPLLREVEAVADVMRCGLADAAPEVVGRLALDGAASGLGWGIIRYTSDKQRDSNLLSPEKVAAMLAAAAGGGTQLRIVHIHRKQLFLSPPAPANMKNPDHVIRMRNLLRWEGFVSLQSRFGTGPWAAGLDNRPTSPPP